MAAGLTDSHEINLTPNAPEILDCDLHKRFTSQIDKSPITNVTAYSAFAARLRSLPCAQRKAPCGRLPPLTQCSDLRFSGSLRIGSRHLRGASGCSRNASHFRRLLVGRKPGHALRRTESEIFGSANKRIARKCVIIAGGIT